MRFTEYVLTFVAVLVVTGHLALQHNVAFAQVTSPAPNSPSQAVPSDPQPTSQPTLLNSRSFSIPFTVDAAGTQPAKVELYVGRNDSNSAGSVIRWERFGEAPPAAQQFQFTAADDGLYYFTTRTIDVAGHAHSFGNRLDVLINTTGPEIHLVADADDSGRIDVQYEIKDISPVKQVHLQYMSDTERAWRPIELSPVAAGDPDAANDGSIAATSARLSFTPPVHWDQVYVQATVIDAAGNQKSTHVSVQRPRIAALPHSNFAASTPVATPSARPAPYRVADHPVGQMVQWGGVTQPAIANSTGGVTVTAVPTGAGTDAAPGYENIPLPTSPTAAPPTASEKALGLGLAPPLQSPSTGNRDENDSPSITPWSAVAPTEPKDSPVNRPRTAAEAIRPLDPETSRPETSGVGSSAVAGPTQTSLPPTGMPLPAGEKLAAENIEQIPLSEEVVKDNAAYAAGRATIQTTIDPRTPLRFSESPRFSLEYELEAIGSGGVEAVELWGSLDGGNSWKRWGSDPDRQSPFDIETNGEGTYAYRIVVVSSSGLASPRPLAGEPADIAVTVDSTKPAIKITGAKYGDGDRVGSLVIQYSCEDAHPLPRPISLAFSESPDGPWTTIAAGLRNEGVYVWPADPQLPRQFYLRADATDSAGNVGTHLLDQPIDAQGLAPRARIRGLQPLTGTTVPNTGDQTATLPTGTFK